MELSCHNKNMSMSARHVAQTSKEDRTSDASNPGSKGINPPPTVDHRHLHDQQLDHQYSQQVQGRDSNPNPPISKTLSPPLPPPPAPLPPQANTPSTNGAAPIQYKECLRNHAAGMAAHIVDGCGEFMPGGEEGTPEELRCAACYCHRNFHRKEVEGEPGSHANSYYPPYINYRGSHTTSMHLPQVSTSLPQPPQQHHQYCHGFPAGQRFPPMMLSLGFGRGSRAPAESSSEDLNMLRFNGPTQVLEERPFSASKKRFRTKFTQEQKDRMQEFAERLDWRIQKQDKQEVQRFCTKVGVKRQVFKVWMHNSKQAMKKKQL